MTELTEFLPNLRNFFKLQIPMSAWRHQAFDQLPEFRSALQKAKNPYAYWIDLQFEFDNARRSENLDLATRILNYAQWSVLQPEGKTAEDDLGTCIYHCFFEHLQPVLEQRKTQTTCLQAIRQSDCAHAKDLAAKLPSSR